MIPYFVPAAVFVKVFSTDDCCGDRDAVQDALGPAAEDISPSRPAETVGSLPVLAFPADKTPRVIQSSSEKCEIASHAIAQLLAEAKMAVTQMNIPGMRCALGFDAEWEVWSSGPQPIATVQLATVRGTTIIFHVKYARKQVFPVALRNVLERDDILKARICCMVWKSQCRFVRLCSLAGTACVLHDYY